VRVNTDIAAPIGPVTWAAMGDVIRGRLLDPAAAPRSGEHVDELVRVRNLVIEQILSGDVEPAEYLQAQDEWVVVLAGSATLELDSGVTELRHGDWVLLPAGARHRLVEVQPGTSWLAVHLHPAARAEADKVIGELERTAPAQRSHPGPSAPASIESRAVPTRARSWSSP
jgi:cupin 2 domain-containing protein